MTGPGIKPSFRAELDRKYFFGLWYKFTLNKYIHIYQIFLELSNLLVTVVADLRWVFVVL